MLKWFVLSLVVIHVAAHSKVYCTNLVLDAAGNPVRCDGWPNMDSVYVHIWGPGNAERQGALNGQNLQDQWLVKDILEGRKRITTGTTPDSSKRAQVKRGQRIYILWSLNGHDGPIEVQWERNREALQPNAREPDYNTWISEGNRIFSSPYRSSPSRCENYQLHQGTLGTIMASQPNAGGGPGYGGLSEYRACWAAFNIPSDMPLGLNRLLYKWHHPPNDARFYDAMWFDVTGDGGAPPTTGCGDTPPPPGTYTCAQQKGWNKCGEVWMQGYCRTSCGTCGGGGGVGLNGASVPSGANPVLSSGNVYDFNFYYNKYDDLRRVLGNNPQALLNHWYSNGMQECRGASAKLDPSWYLNKYADLKAHYGDRNCKGAVEHYALFGNKEGRQGRPSSSALVVETRPYGMKYKFENGTNQLQITLGLDAASEDLGPEVEWSVQLVLTEAAEIDCPPTNEIAGTAGENNTLTFTGKGALKPTTPPSFVVVLKAAGPAVDKYNQSTEDLLFVPDVASAAITVNGQTTPMTIFHNFGDFPVPVYNTSDTNTKEPSAPSTQVPTDTAAPSDGVTDGPKLPVSKGFSASHPSIAVAALAALWHLSN